MKEIESTGKTVDVAISVGLRELGVERDRVKIEILDAVKKEFWNTGYQFGTRESFL